MRLSAWIEPLLDAEQMRALDEWAIAERGAGVLDLMEAAGSALAEGVMRAAPNGPVIALCGKGNNGGDGLVAVRLLRKRGIDAHALLLGDTAELSEASAANAERLDGEGLGSFGSGGSEQLEAASVLIDAIFGTGFSGEPRGIAGEAIEAINASGAPVVAADIPSGVDASSGEAADAQRPGRGDRHFPQRQGRSLDRAGQGTLRRADGGADRHPGRRSRDPGLWADRRDGARPRAPSRLVERQVHRR